MAVEEDVLAAVGHLEEAKSETSCAWCRRTFDKAAKVLRQAAEVSQYGDETSRQVASKTEKELAELGGKVGVLHKVVKRAQAEGNVTGVRKSLNSLDDDYSPRGMSMDKKDGVRMLGGSLALGTGLGFVLNRVDDMFSAGQPWYLHIGPAVNVLGGAALAYMAIKGKPFKGEGIRTAVAAGGATMVSLGALQYLEGLMGTMGVAARMPARYASARGPGQLPIRVVETTRSY